MGKIEVVVLLFKELERPRLDLRTNPMVRCLAARPVANTIIALGPHPFDQPPQLSLAQRKATKSLLIAVKGSCVSQAIESLMRPVLTNRSTAPPMHSTAEC